MATRITPPADFPVHWPQADDSQHHWTRDREHLPHPVTVLYQTVSAVAYNTARARTQTLYDEAYLTLHGRRLNTYLYTRLIPVTGQPEALAARAATHHAKVSAVAVRLGELWHTTWLPELQAMFADWEAADLTTTDRPTLATLWEKSLRYATRMWELHQTFGPPMWLALHEWVTLYTELFPQHTALDAHTFLQGFDNQTLRLNRALWSLSDHARQCPAVHQALAAPTWPQAHAALAATPAGQNFLAAWHAFLHTWGGRSDLWDWGYPSWQDDPTPVFNTLKLCLAQPPRHLAAEQAEQAAQRDQRVAHARATLQRYPTPVLERFDTWLRAAQEALTLTENHTFYLDFNGFGHVHRVALAVGRVLAGSGQLATPADVFHLTLEELRTALADPAHNFGPQAEARRHELAHWASYAEPAELGTRPDHAPVLYSPEAQRIPKYIGGLVGHPAPTPAEAPSQLHGQGGSAGRVRGPARLILNLHHAHRLRPGDILVTTTTAPPWTPLFLTAAGLVTDAGGLLSHGAVVAREYGLPAVVGTRQATTCLRDGEWIEVDGAAGTVTRLPDPA